MVGEGLLLVEDELQTCMHSNKVGTSKVEINDTTEGELQPTIGKKSGECRG